jgi:hypothetical protein
MPAINSQSNLRLLANGMTSDHNIILNAVVHCMRSVYGPYANSERLISWLKSCSIEASVYDVNKNRIQIAYAIDSNGDVLYIRLGQRHLDKKWFIYATCIEALNLPINRTK